MWLIVMFDLPTMSETEKTHYREFRKFLLNDGFIMLQYSIYARHCPNAENADVHVKRIEYALPPEGEVRVMRCTDKQFEHIRIFYGPLPRKPEQPPEQITLL